MMQGDACYLGVEILNSGGSVVTAADVKDVEIRIGPLTKGYLAEELSFCGGIWLVPLSQEESFLIPPGPVKAQVRVLWTSGVVEGKTLPGVYMEESISKEVL